MISAPRAKSIKTRRAAAILLGAAFLLWPAILNRYPILFSDTGGLLEMGLLPSMGWDKPVVYGPLIAAISLHWTLCLPVIVQAILVSLAIWLVQTAYAHPAPGRHLAITLALATLTPAPWFASTLMPDVFTPIAALTLIAATRRPLAILLAATAIAAHLSHLVMAAAVIATLCLLTRTIAWRPLAALAAALCFLIGSNWIGYGRPAISPNGAIFALARLIADGPARIYLDRVCPAANLILCPWRDRLTTDSDEFLWDPASPFWADPAPLPQFAAEAGRIVLGTIQSQPAAVLRDAYRATARQLVRTDIGDTLGPDYVFEAVRPRIARWYPAAELTRFDQSRQLDSTFATLATHLIPLYRAVLVVGLASSTLFLLQGIRRPSPRADFAALVLIALAANAFSTGALSSVHDRYQARIAWLIVLPALLRFPSSRPYAALNASDGTRTSAS